MNATSTKNAKPSTPAKHVPAPKPSAAKTAKTPVAPAKKPAVAPKSISPTQAKTSASAPKKTVTTPIKKTTPAPASKAAAPAAKKTAASTAVASKAPAAAVKPASKAPLVIKAAPVAASVLVPVAPKVPTQPSNDPAAVPVKSGRPSSRLAQLTVPSMAQSVASTAAKASFGNAYEAEPVAPVIPAPVKKDPKLANNWKTKPVDQLSDAELQAMPDSEYMNDVHMAAFRLKLVVLKREILSNAGETTEHLREDTSVVPDPTDRATMPWSCAPGTANANCSKKSNNRLPVLMPAITAIAMKPARPSASDACWPGPRPRYRWKRNSAASSNKRCSAIKAASWARATIPSRALLSKRNQR